jgi:hypothetical protein
MPKKSLRFAESDKSDPRAVQITLPLTFTYNRRPKSCQILFAFAQAVETDPAVSARILFGRCAKK